MGFCDKQLHPRNSKDSFLFRKRFWIRIHLRGENVCWSNGASHEWYFLQHPKHGKVVWCPPGPARFLHPGDRKVPPGLTISCISISSISLTGRECGGTSGAKKKALGRPVKERKREKILWGRERGLEVPWPAFIWLRSAPAPGLQPLRHPHLHLAQGYDRRVILRMVKIIWWRSAVSSATFTTICHFCQLLPTLANFPNLF